MPVSFHKISIKLPLVKQALTKVFLDVCPRNISNRFSLNKTKVQKQVRPYIFTSLESKSDLYYLGR